MITGSNLFPFNKVLHRTPHFNTKNPSVQHEKPLRSTPKTPQFNTPLSSTPKIPQFHTKNTSVPHIPQFHTKNLSVQDTSYKK